MIRMMDFAEQWMQITCRGEYESYVYTCEQKSSYDIVLCSRHAHKMQLQRRNSSSLHALAQVPPLRQYRIRIHSQSQTLFMSMAAI